MTTPTSGLRLCAVIVLGSNCISRICTRKTERAKIASRSGDNVRVGESERERERERVRVGDNSLKVLA